MTARTESSPAKPLRDDSIIGSPQRRWFLPLLVLSWFGSGIVVGSISGASLPKLLTLMDEASKEDNLALISAVGGVVIMIATPLFGRLSDRTTSRMGMRRPWSLGGALLGSVGCVVLALAGGVPQLVLGWIIVQIGYGAVSMVNHTLLADQVPARIRARVSAAVGVANAVSTIVATGIVASLPIDQRWLWFAVPGVLGLVTVLPLCFGFRDVVRTEKPEPLKLRDVLSTYWLNPLQYRDFAWAWASRFFMTMSILTISLFLFFLIMDTLGYSADEAGGVQTTALAMFMGGNIVATVIFGWLSDRLGKRKVIVWASGLCSGAGVCVLLFSGGMTSFLAGMLVIGFAQGAYVAVDVALMTEVLPSRADAGKDLGIVALAYQLPQIIGPVVGAGVISLAGGDYTGLFLFSMICSVLGGILIIPIRGVK
ncbi:MFS transporter [Brachybacterium endophyticum]|uniref:MFS transporter n=1 Tax=Brachybacterium endophyticum TaxID=2182385 RepID=A0A2U2RN25_9MICO|nr:MFS transporter [Brachybacterium endophyticum]PWH07287.1 MFS transporter [Brachybacterium endophyticum]